MQETTQFDQLSMTSEAARELEVAPTTLLTWDRTGKIRSIKTTNGRRLFPRSEIERVKREREQKRA
jgi:predicted site-specific integrase-resolvase